MRRRADIAARGSLASPAAAPELRRVFEDHVEFVRALAQQLLGGYGDADDVAQEVFFLAWRKLDQFRGEGMRTWLCRITVKVAAAARRRAWWRHRLGLNEVPEPVERRTPERSAEIEEAGRIFQLALAKMDERKRAVFVLFEIHGFNGQEIASALGCSLEAVHTRLFRARREFVRNLEHLERETVRRPGRLPP